MSSTINTSQLRLAVGGQSGFPFDNVSLHSTAMDVDGSTAYCRYGNVRKILTLAGLLLIILLSSSCSNTMGVELPNKYVIVRCSKYIHIIVNLKTEEREIVVAETVQSYAILGDIIIGNVVDPGVGYPKDEPIGYFILDTKTDEIKKGLSEGALMDSLKKTYNITNKPKMIEVFSLKGRDNDLGHKQAEEQLLLDMERKGDKHPSRMLGKMGEKILLPNSHLLARDQWGYWEVVLPDGDFQLILAGPSVVAYAVVDDHVAGQCIESDDIPQAFRDQEGYFILNTNTGEVVKELTKEETEKRLIQEAGAEPPIVYTLLND